jgi:hypothetical protein
MDERGYYEIVDTILYLVILLEFCNELESSLQDRIECQRDSLKGVHLIQEEHGRYWRVIEGKHRFFDSSLCD